MNNTAQECPSDPDMSICFSEDGTTSPPHDFVTARTKANAPVNTSIGEQLHDFKEEVRKMISYLTATHGQQLAEVNATLKSIKESNQNIESAVTYLSEQNEEFRSKISHLECQIKEDREYIRLLENKLEEGQIAHRKADFVIKNVPRTENESKKELVEMVVCLSSNLECKMTLSDIKDIYRVRSKKTEHTNAPIIVETNSTLLKTDLLKKAKMFNTRHHEKLRAKHVGMKTNEEVPIFLSEHLTANSARLHYLSRDLAKSKNYKFCWTAYGKVYVRKDEQSPIIMIRNEEQVHSLLCQD